MYYKPYNISKAPCKSKTQQIYEYTIYKMVALYYLS